MAASSNQHKELMVFGMGDHATVVVDAARLSGWTVTGYYDQVARPQRAGNIPWLGSDVQVVNLTSAYVVAIGKNDLRKRVTERLQTISTQLPVNICHPRSVSPKSARLGSGCQLLAGVLINPGATIGNGTIINTGAIVEHDCTVGDFCHLAPGAVLTGGVVVENGVFIGANATVLPRLRIGAGATVGAGAVVTRDVLSGVTVVGNPAKPMPQKSSE